MDDRSTLGKVHMVGKGQDDEEAYWHELVTFGNQFGNQFGGAAGEWFGVVWLENLGNTRLSRRFL